MQAEAVAAAALLLESGGADAASGAFAGEGVHPVLPRAVDVEEGGLERVGRHRAPPGADPVDAAGVVALEVVPALLDSGFARDLDGGVAAGLCLGEAEGDQFVDLELAAAERVEFDGEGVVVGPAGGAGVLGEGVELGAGGVEGESVGAQAASWCARHRVPLPRRGCVVGREP